MLKAIPRELGDKILLENWDGEAPLIPLLEDILGAEKGLVGDGLQKILRYMGHEGAAD